MAVQQATTLISATSGMSYILSFHWFLQHFTKLKIPHGENGTSVRVKRLSYRLAAAELTIRYPPTDWGIVFVVSFTNFYYLFVLIYRSFIGVPQYVTGTFVSNCCCSVSPSHTRARGHRPPHPHCSLSSGFTKSTPLWHFSANHRPFQRGGVPVDEGKHVCTST